MNSIWSNSQVSNNLAERLIWQDPITGEYKPWLAESYQTSDDHLAYTFKLRSGVTFSDGTPLDAAVVKANFDQHGFGDESLGITQDPFWTDYAGTDVVDDSTVVVRLSKPNAGFIQILSNYRASSILGKSTLEKDLNGQSDLRNWVGTGPFVVESVEGTTGVTSSGAMTTTGRRKARSTRVRPTWSASCSRRFPRPAPGSGHCSRGGPDRPQHRPLRRGDGGCRRRDLAGHTCAG